MSSVIALVAQLVQLGIPIAEEIQAAVVAEMALSGSGTAPTPEQQASIDLALEQAHNALQAASQAAP